MAVIEWEDRFSVGIAEMDEQHKRLVGLLNTFNQALSEGRGKAALYDVLMSLIEYTKQHFRDEEALMEAKGYPGLEEHRQEHKELTGQVVDFAREFNAGNKTITIGLMHFLRDWLVNHIMGEDKKYGDFITA